MFDFVKDNWKNIAISLLVFVLFFSFLYVLGDNSKSDGEQQEGKYTKFFINSSQANIRDCKDSHCPIVSDVRKNRYFGWRSSKYSSIEDMPQWVKVNLKGKSGYVNKKFLSERPSERYNWYLKDNTNVRSCGSTDCEVLFVAKKGEELELPYSADKEMPEWVSFASETGGDSAYVHSSLLSREKPEFTWYLSSDANARACSSKKCKVVQTYNRGSSIELQAQTTEDLPDWVRVTEGGRNLYVHSSLFTKNDPIKRASANTQKSAQREGGSASAESGKKEEGSISLSDVIDYWEPWVVQVVCEFRYDDTDELYNIQVGSGTLVDTGDSGFEVMTNKHVIQDSGGHTPDECTIEMSSSERKYSSPGDGEGFSAIPNRDFAVIEIANPDSYLKTLSDQYSSGPNDSGIDICTERPEIGTPIVVLGYPSIGASDSITVTRGIVSGRERGYYVTDAKIDEGNSGGAAIIPGANCMLGVPTKTAVGEAESLGRILDLNAIYQGTY